MPRIDPASTSPLTFRPVVHGRTPSPDVDRIAQAVADTSEALESLKGVLSGSADSADLSKAIAQHLRLIEEAAEQSALAGSGVAVVGVSPKVEAYDVDADLAPGEALDILVEVHAPASEAVLELSFTSAAGTPSSHYGIDLASPDSQFKVELAGAEGVQVFSFASGTTISDITQAINAFSSQTGVSAAIDYYTGKIQLGSVGVGSDQFVSVKVIDDGGAAGQGIIEENGAVTAFDSPDAADGLVDNGTDVVAKVNGQQAVGVGDLITFESESLSLSVLLNDFEQDRFRALRIVGVGAAGQEAQAPEPPTVGALSDALARGGFKPPSHQASSLLKPFGD